MKRERRQELKTNELSVQLQRISDYIQQRATTLIVIGIGVILVVGALLYRQYSLAQANEQGWQAFYQATSGVDRASRNWVDGVVQNLEVVVANYDDPTLQTQARRQLVTLCLDEVTQADDDARKAELIDLAESQARAALEGAGPNVPLKAAALNWLAAVEENRFALDEDPTHQDKAKAYLNRIVDGEEFRPWPAFTRGALDRLNGYDSLWQRIVLLKDPEPIADETPDPLDIDPTDVDAADDSSQDESDPISADDLTGTEAPPGAGTTPAEDTEPPADSGADEGGSDDSQPPQGQSEPDGGR